MFKIKTILYCCFKPTEDMLKGDSTAIQSQLGDIDGKAGPKLVITPIDSTATETSQQSSYYIGPSGLVNSLRCPKDGAVYGGTISGVSTGASTESKGAECLNDIILPEADPTSNSTPAQRNFVIRYQEQKKSYTIQDLGAGSGTFIKITDPQCLSTANNTIVSFGDTHMIVRVQNEGQQTLRVKFVDGPKAMQAFTFNKEETPSVTIGRMSDCQIVFDSSSLSRYQCTVYWDDIEEAWMVIDGNMVRGSTNGTWLFVDEPYELTSGTIFKAGAAVFQAEIATSIKS